MKKSLNDLTKDDWNTLFPIKLVDHNPQWKTIYNEENDRGAYVLVKTDFVNQIVTIIDQKACKTF